MVANVGIGTLEHEPFSSIQPRHPEARAKRASKDDRPRSCRKRASGTTGAVVLRGPRFARPPQDDGAGSNRAEQALAYLAGAVTCSNLVGRSIPHQNAWR